jgi:hypothetical protein
MRRPAIVLAALLLSLSVAPATASHWWTNWHWPGPGVGSSYDPDQTWVYFVATDDLYRRHIPLVDHAAEVWRRSPRVAIRRVSRCPTNANCVRFVTRDLAYPFLGQTWISWGGNNHILAATVRFDVVLGTARTSRATDLEAACFESMLSLGGGWNNPDTELNEHAIGCNGSGYPTAHDYDAVNRVYSHLH